MRYIWILRKPCCGEGEETLKNYEREHCTSSREEYFMSYCTQENGGDGEDGDAVGVDLHELHRERKRCGP